MTALTHSTDAQLDHTPSVSPRREDIDTCSSIIETLTERRKDDDCSLAEQANLLAVQISEETSLHKIIILAGIGLNLSQPHQQDDDMLGAQLFWLFGEIADAAVEEGRRKAN